MDGGSIKLRSNKYCKIWTKSGCQKHRFNNWVWSAKSSTAFDHRHQFSFQLNIANANICTLISYRRLTFFLSISGITPDEDKLNRILVPKTAVDRPFEAWLNLTSIFCKTLNGILQRLPFYSFSNDRGGTFLLFSFLSLIRQYCQPYRLTTYFCAESMTVSRPMNQDVELYLGEDIELKIDLSVWVLTGSIFTLPCWKQLSPASANLESAIARYCRGILRVA